MKNKLSGVLAATLALTISLPTGAMAVSDNQTTVVVSQEVANHKLKKLQQRRQIYSRSPMRRLVCSMR